MKIFKKHFTKLKHRKLKHAITAVTLIFLSVLFSGAVVLWIGSSLTVMLS